MAAQYEVKLVIKILFTATLIVLVLFLVFSYFLSIPLGLALFFSTPQGWELSQLYVLGLPLIFDFYFPVVANVGLVFLFLVGLYALCFIAAWLSRESLHEVIAKAFSRPFSQLFNNNLFAMPTIASMLLISFVVIHIIFSVPTGPGPFEPSEDPLQPFQYFFELTYSPLVEEISFRIIPFSVFFIVYMFVVGRERMATLSWGGLLKVLFLIPLYPDKAKELFGMRTVREFGIRGLSLAEWIMIVLTSVAFGLAHPLSGSGWEPGKSISVSLDGLAFSLAYLLYGAQAPILLHWFFNYFIGGYSAYTLALDFYPILSPIVSLTYSVILILGLFGWPMFTILLGDWLYRRWKGSGALPPSPTQPPTPPPPIIRFCHQCGRSLSEGMKFCPYCGKAIEEERKEKV